MSQLSNPSSNRQLEPVYGEPALQVVGLEDSLDRDDATEHSNLPSPTGFGEQTTQSGNTDQLAYVQRCLLQIKDRMLQHQRDTLHRQQHSSHNYSKTPTPSEDLAYAVQTAMINTTNKELLKKDKKHQQQYERDARVARYMLEQAAKDQGSEDVDNGNQYNDVLKQRREQEDSSDSGM